MRIFSTAIHSAALPTYSKRNTGRLKCESPKLLCSNNQRSIDASKIAYNVSHLRQKKQFTGNPEALDRNSGLRNNLISIEELNEDQENQDQLLSFFKSKVDFNMNDYLVNIEQKLNEPILVR